MRKLLFLLFAASLLFGAYNLKNDFSIEQHIVRSLDIPISFLHTKKFAKFKKKYARYKTHHFFDVNRPETYFIPELVKIINAEHIPDVFLYMAMAESHFAAKAKSHKSAVGIWQFMRGTAKLYGLRVDEFVDERRDPYKSTYAAIAYLKHLHTLFGKWYLAALAYNAGEGAVLRAIKRAKSDDIAVLLDEKKKYLGKESRNYLYKIVMLALMANDKEYYLSSDLAYILTRGEEYAIAPVAVKGAEVLGYVAKKIRLRPRYLKELNPHILRGFTPPGKKYTIYIPKIKLQEFIQNYTPSNMVQTFLTYRVKSGDSLYKIAKRFGIKVALLKRFNRLRSNILHIRQHLIIPIPKKASHYYKVRRGDTLIKIAKRFGVSAKNLKRWNNKRDNFLRVGERLVVLY